MDVTDEFNSFRYMIFHQPIRIVSFLVSLGGKDSVTMEGM